MRARTGWGALIFVWLLLFIGVADASAAPTDDASVVEAVWTPTASPPAVVVPLAVLPYEASYTSPTLNPNSQTMPVLTDTEALAQLLNVATNARSAPRILTVDGSRLIDMDLYRRAWKSPGGHLLLP